MRVFWTIMPKIILNRKFNSLLLLENIEKYIWDATCLNELQNCESCTWVEHILSQSIINYLFRYPHQLFRILMWEDRFVFYFVFFEKKYIYSNYWNDIELKVFFLFSQKTEKPERKSDCKNVQFEKALLDRFEMLKPYYPGRYTPLPLSRLYFCKRNPSKLFCRRTCPSVSVATKCEQTDMQCVQLES